MDFTEIMGKYEAIPIDENALSDYEKFAFKVFHDPSIVSNPNLEITIQFDITDVSKVYEKRYKKTKGSSFTAYLYWGLFQTIKKHPYFSYRRIDNRWYEFKNIPIFFPIAIGGKERFNTVMMEDVMGLEWPEFCKRYRLVIDDAMENKSPHVTISLEMWHFAFFFGNLPNIQFSHFSLHVPVEHFGRPAFYFGKRYTNGKKKHIPLYILFDHSNLDPYVESNFLEDYNKVLLGEI